MGIDLEVVGDDVIPCVLSVPEQTFLFFLEKICSFRAFQFLFRDDHKRSYRAPSCPAAPGLKNWEKRKDHRTLLCSDHPGAGTGACQHLQYADDRKAGIYDD